MSDEQLLEVRLSGFISASCETVVESLVQLLRRPEEQQQFRDFCYRVERLYLSRCYERSKLLHRSFERMVLPSLETYSDPAQLHKFEDEFLDLLHTSLLDGNYTILSQREYDDATAHEFALNINVELDKKQLETSMTDRFVDRHAHDAAAAGAAEINRSILVYHRGVGMAKETGFFLFPKLDIVVGWGTDIITKRAKGYALKALQFLRLVAQEPQEKQSDVQDAEETAKRKGQTSAFGRISLEHLIEADKRNLMRTLTLEEPTFKELVVIHRTAEAAASTPKGRAVPVSLKIYSDVPMADFEIVLPGQKPVTRSFDLVKLVIAVVLGIYAVYAELSQTSDSGEAESLSHAVQDAMPILIAAFTYISKLIVQYQSQVAEYTMTMTKYLYDKTLTTGDGVRSHLGTSTHRQEVLEVILAYFFIWQGRARTIDSLGATVKSHLATLGENTYFPVYEAVDKLRDDGFCRVDSLSLHATSELTSEPIDKALAQLDRFWMAMFRSEETAATEPDAGAASPTKSGEPKPRFLRKIFRRKNPSPVAS